jgi:phospholipid-binding lipoprotein MlaA
MNKRRLVIISVLCLLLTGCSMFKRGDNPRDPFEKSNRRIYAFNQGFDKVFWHPIATFYKQFTPWPLRKGISNAYNNIAMLPTVANDILQLEFAHTAKDSWRFIINSTVGVAGLVDVAKHAGLPAHYNDMGLTFRRWGDKKPAYVEIPFLGPSTMAYSYGLTFDWVLFSVYPLIKPAYLRYSVMGMSYVNTRAKLLETGELVDKAALDPYAFQRDAFLQYRDNLYHQNSRSPKKEEAKDENSAESDIDAFLDEEQQAEDAKEKADDKKTETSDTQPTAARSLLLQRYIVRSVRVPYRAG